MHYLPNFLLKYMDCKRGNPVSALGVGGKRLWKKNNCSPHLQALCVWGLAIKIKKIIKNYGQVPQNYVQVPC